MPCALHEQSLQPSIDLKVSPTLYGPFGAGVVVFVPVATSWPTVSSHEHVLPLPVAPPFGCFFSSCADAEEPTGTSPELHAVATSAVVAARAKQKEKRVDDVMSVGGRMLGRP